MALILKDRVKESSSSSGTGSITLGGAFPGYQTFNAAIASGSTVYYTIHNLAAGFDTEWEVGVGTFTSPATLARNTVLSSSTGSLVNFTAGTEGLEVFITQPAEEAVYLNQATGIVEVGGNGTNTVAFTNINASNVVMVSGTISTNAANATDITNKTYVDGLFSTGISYHAPVLVESPDTAGNLNAVYVQPNGAGNGVGATLTNNGANAALVIDGVTLSNTARVLVYNQSNAVQNGVYTVTNPGAPDSPGPGAKWVLTRATDADTFGLANPNALGAGDAFYVQSGNTGAGETYVCNTQGTITFGSSNITFAQISSAQVYSAGTGLNLSNLTFSIANTAVTANTYGNDGAVGQFTVNAQGQITNAATVSVNASAISVGTLANARTTASDANGASTIVSRDTNGSFAANVVTATTVNATSGNFTNITGNAIALTAINASNITSGTLDNARTTGNTANSASTLVLRDSNGAFDAGNVTASNFIGAGTTITSINASNISSGTIANSRTTAASANGASTIVLRDSGGNFVANTITANISGDISGGTNINASNITSGTISNARTTASSANGASTIVLRDTNGSFDANVVNATNLSGGGTSITSMNASNLSAGTVASARISGSYTGITGVGTVTAGTWQGNAVGVSYGGTGTSTQFTAGSVVFAGTSGVYSQSNAQLFWDNTNSRLGIGLTNPTQKLEVTGNIKINSGVVAGERGNAAAPAFSFSDDLDTGMFNVSNLDLGFSTQGTERMRITSGGNVVIGNGETSATPAAGVLEGTDGSGTNIAGASLTLQGGRGTGTGAGGALIFQTSAAGSSGSSLNAATERMRIDSSGNVGIGTSSPSYRLEANSGSTDATALFDSTSVNGSHIRIASSGTVKNYIGCAAGFVTSGSADDLGLRAVGKISFATNGAAADMTLDASGNLGIGTSSPVGRLAVNGISNLGTGFASTDTTNTRPAYVRSSDNNSLISFQSSSTTGDGFMVGMAGAEPRLQVTNNLPLIILTNNTERMRIDSSGNVGIGTSSPSVRFHVSAGAVNTGIIAQTSNAESYIQLTSSGGSSYIGTKTNGIEFLVNAAGNYAARFASSGGFSVGTTSDPGAGAIYATGNITAYFSDKRLKNVSGKIENALDKVNSLSGVYYTMNDVAKANGYDSDETQVGVLAQEVEAVLPEIVKPAPFDLDENNNSKSGENYKTVQYEKLVPLLIEAIKELKAEVDALKGK